MKKMNRREFGSSAPAVPTGKEAELVAAINKVWKKKFVAGQVTHEQLTLNQDAVDVISAYGHVFEKANETPHILTKDDVTMISEGSDKFAKKMKKYGNNSFAGMAGVFPRFPAKEIALEDAYSCEDTAVQAFVEKLLTSLANSSKAEYISIYLPVVKNVTYMTAVVFWNKTA